MRQDIVLGKTMKEWQNEFPLLRDMMELKEVFWLNNNKLPAAQAIATSELSLEDIFDAEARLKRFAPYFCEAFPETKETDGVLESPLRPIERMQAFLSNPLNKPFNDSLNDVNDKNREAAKSSMCEEAVKISINGEPAKDSICRKPAKDSICGEPVEIMLGRLLLKCDNELPISGSIKARGGIYEVLKFAEDIALESGMLKESDCYAVLVQPKFRELFSRYSIAVGSTGNLGLSIGIISAKLGFQVTVHMSADARQWKKDMLRDKGVVVKEYEEDYSIAVAQGRKEAAKNPYCHFVDDENSKTLFLGYSVAALRLKKQLREEGICVDATHPLFVYLPCGVGGGPGGVAFGLKQVFGDSVHCFFAEPTHSPCMLLGMMTGYHDAVCVQDFGIDNRTAADGLAVGRASRFVGRLMTPFLSGIYSIADEHMFRMLHVLYDEEKIPLEPSALAGMAVPYLISFTERGRQCTQKENLRDKMSQATHIVWATGGGMVPNAEWKQYYEMGRRFAFE